MYVKNPTPTTKEEITEKLAKIIDLCPVITTTTARPPA
jgi:hypothetical protein